MVEFKVDDMKHFGFILAILVFCIGCNTLNFSDDEQRIYYKQTVLGKCNYDVFQINNDGTFLYYRNWPDLCSLVDVCDTTEGKWIRKGDTIILNSNFQYKDFVKYISEFEHKDSIKIRYINYSNNEPVSNYLEILFKDDCNSTSFEDCVFETISDSNGIMTIPCQGYKLENYERYLIGFMDIEVLRDVEKLDCGRYYEIIRADCVPIIFENKMFKLKRNKMVEILDSNDTLSSIVDKYKQIKKTDIKPCK